MNMTPHQLHPGQWIAENNVIRPYMEKPKFAYGFPDDGPSDSMLQSAEHDFDVRIHEWHTFESFAKQHTYATDLPNGIYQAEQLGEVVWQAKHETEPDYTSETDSLMFIYEYDYERYVADICEGYTPRQFLTTKPMSKELTPTAGLQVEDIKRVTPLIRAMYLGQDVNEFIADAGDQMPNQLNSRNINEPVDSAYLLLRPLSSITDDEIILLQFRDFKHGIEFVKRTHYEDERFFILEIKVPSKYNGKPTSYNELISFHYSRLSIKEYQWLIQHGFALDFYDSVTNTTITVEQQISAGVIKLKS
jgi:hypothetical protein